jgi:hypothetical protein
MKKVLAASPVAALPKLDFQPAKTLINDATINWWLGSTAFIFVLLLCVECKSIAAFLIACGCGVAVASVNSCTNLFIKTATQLQVLKEYHLEETQALEVAQLTSSQHKREIELDLPPCDAYDRVLQALAAVPEARLTKIKMRDGIIVAEAAHGVRLTVEINEVPDDRSHLVLSARTHFLHEFFHTDRSLQMLLHLRRKINRPSECPPQQLVHLFKPSFVRSAVSALKLSALAGLVVFGASCLVGGIQQGRTATEARAQYKIGNYEEVVRATGRLERQPSEVVSMRAIALANTGKTDEALELLSDRIAKNSDYDLFVYRAYVHVIAGDIAKALLDLDKAENFRMHMDFKHYVRALIAEHDKDYEQAADELVVAIELNTDEAVYHQENAKVLRQLNEVDEAVEESARAEAIIYDERAQLNTETGGIFCALILLQILFWKHRLRARRRVQPGVAS